MDDQEDHQGSADADGEAQDIDHRKNLIATEIPECYEEIVFEHDGAFRCVCRHPMPMP
jgi:hypothetical protein